MASLKDLIAEEVQAFLETQRDAFGGMRVVQTKSGKQQVKSLYTKLWGMGKAAAKKKISSPEKDSEFNSYVKSLKGMKPDVLDRMKKAWEDGHATASRMSRERSGRTTGTTSRSSTGKTSYKIGKYEIKLNADNTVSVTKDGRTIRDVDVPPSFDAKDLHKMATNIAKRQGLKIEAHYGEPSKSGDEMDMLGKNQPKKYKAGKRKATKKAFNKRVRQQGKHIQAEGYNFVRGISKSNDMALDVIDTALKLNKAKFVKGVNQFLDAVMTGTKPDRNLFKDVIKHPKFIETLYAKMKQTDKYLIPYTDFVDTLKPQMFRLADNIMSVIIGEWREWMSMGGPTELEDYANAKNKKRMRDISVERGGQKFAAMYNASLTNFKF